jgi:predicted transcriptional regulator
MTRPIDEKAEPSDLELQVLSVLWDRGPSTVRQVLDAMPDGKERAYTTVLTVLQSLEKKRLVRHKQRGRQYVYRAAADRSGVLAPRLRRLIRHVFGGDPAAVLQHILDGTEVSADDLAAMRELLAEHERQQGRKGRRDRG